MKKLSVCSALVAGLVGLSAMCLSGNAATTKQLQLQSAERLAESYVTVAQSVDEIGTETKTYGNIAAYKSKLDKNIFLTKTDKAKLLYKSMGMSEDRIENLSETELSEAFKFTECITTTSYIVSNDEESMNISQKEMVNALALSDDLTMEGEALLEGNRNTLYNECDIMPMITPTQTTSHDGYMRIDTSAYYEEKDSIGRVYFIADIYAEWLKLPAMDMEDVFVMVSDAHFDNTYTYSGDYGHDILEYDGIRVRRNFGMHYRRAKGDEHAYNTATLTNTDSLWFDFQKGINSLAIRFYPSSYKFDRINGYTYKESKKASVRARYYLQNVDAGIQGAYSHKTFGIGSVGISGGFNSISFSASWILQHSDYFGEPVYVKIP